jgi:hypothetical protein
MTGCDLYLRAGSRPIIEACTGLRFAPLPDRDLSALGLRAALEAAGLPDCASGLWRAVDDFGWVKAAASPNWGVLPEGERAAAAPPPDGAAGRELLGPGGGQQEGRGQQQQGQAQGEAQQLEGQQQQGQAQQQGQQQQQGQGQQQGQQQQQQEQEQ